MSFEELFNDENSKNKYVSDDGTESWFDYRINDITYSCEKLNYDKCFYIIGAWFYAKNYDSLNFHVCRFQVKSKDFTKAFNRIKKLCSQEDIIFDGGYDFYENTSGSHWKHIRYDKR